MRPNDVRGTGRNPFCVALRSTAGCNVTLLQKLASRAQKITDFNTLEVSGIKIFRQGRDTIHERCKPNEANYWTVFGHLRRGGVDDFQDFRTQAQAEKYHDRLLKRYPHFSKFRACAWKKACRVAVK